MCVNGNVYVCREVKRVGPVSVCVIYIHPGTGVYLRDGGGGRVQGRAAPGQVVPVPVNEGIEGQAVPPAGGKILDVYLRVTGSVEGRNRGRDGESQEERGRKGETDKQRWIDGWLDR